jgi:hypothetical protein
MCVILYTEINGIKILAKNRDRAYNPSIKIIHELINGVEIAYLKDEKTGWIEGMNANGTGIVNSTLSSFDSKKYNKKIGYKKNVIYNSLLHYKTNKNFFDIITNAKNDYVLEGHTLLYHNGHVYHIENTADNNFVAERKNKPCVYSNHGIRKKDAGYTDCIKGLSTFLRSNIMKHELKENHIKSEDELTNLMNQNYSNINPRNHPYRDKNYTLKRNRNIDPKKVKISTTGQIVLNMTDNEFIYYTDINNSEKIEYINKLPKGYVPKIRISIKETEKNLKNKKKIFTKKYLQKIYSKFDCKKTRKSMKNKNINTRRNQK